MRLDGIQVGRAVAALSVLYFHSWLALVRFPENAAYPIAPLAKFGELGVDLFFAISGFVICMIATKKTFSPIEFLTKRVFRIYPLWLFCLATFAILGAIWRGWQNHETPTYFLYSATLLPTKELPFYGIGWTLQHEMAFYAVVTILFPLVRLPGVIVALIASFALRDYGPWYVSKLAAFHLEFAAGILAYIFWPKLRWIGSLLPIAVGLITLCALFYYLSRLWVAPALFLTIVGFANLKTGPLTQWLVRTGDQSYSIYLVHPIIFWGCSAVTSKIVTHVPLWSLEPIRFACIFLVVFVSQITWKTIERPSIYLGSRLARRWSAEAETAPA